MMSAQCINQNIKSWEWDYLVLSSSSHKFVLTPSPSVHWYFWHELMQCSYFVLFVSYFISYTLYFIFCILYFISYTSMFCILYFHINWRQITKWLCSLDTLSRSNCQLVVRAFWHRLKDPDLIVHPASSPSGPGLVNRLKRKEARQHRIVIILATKRLELNVMKLFRDVCPEESAFLPS